MSKSRRLQVLVEDEQYARLAHEADIRGVSVATVVRDAIDRVVPGGQRSKQAALHVILDAAPIQMPHDPADLRDELAAMYDSPEP